jgi:hypothetical protein
MHGPINVKSSNNTSKWQIGFNSAFKGLMKWSKQLEIKGSEKNGLKKLSSSGPNWNLAVSPIRMNEFTKEYNKISTEKFEIFHV